MSDRAQEKVRVQQKTLIGSSPKSSLLQRTCVCGGSPGIDGLCTECRDKRFTSQGSRRGFEAPSVLAAAQSNSPAQENVTSMSGVVDRVSRFGHDLSRIPIYASMPRAIQMPQTGNGVGDGHAQEAGSVTYDTAGKPAAPFSIDLGFSRSTPFQVARLDGGERTDPEISNKMVGGCRSKSPEATAAKPEENPKSVPKPELKLEEAKKPTKPTITHETIFPAPDGTGKKRTNVGVGEEVTFTGSAIGKWTSTNGTPRELARGVKFTWTAPERTATVTIKLQVETEEATLSMNVIEPASITAHKNSEDEYPNGMAGAGMKIRFRYHPMNVSFGKVQSKEVSGPATNITGYFKNRFEENQLWHDSRDTFYQILKHNWDESIDHAYFYSKRIPYEKGTLDYLIPNKFNQGLD